MAQKPGFVWKQTAERSPKTPITGVALLSLVLASCAPLSPNAKYLFAPEVRTCPPTRSPYGDNYSIDRTCWARVDRPIPKAVYVSPGCYANGSGKIDTVTVAQAANYAAQVEEEYIGAKGEYGSISSAFGLVLIPAGASAMALGALGESATAVSALGFGSAGILGAGYWLSNQNREKAYMSGAGALECLTGTMRPFDVEQGTLTLGQLCRFDSALEQSKKDLQTQITIFAGQLVSYQIRAGGTPDKATRKKLCYAEKLLKAANATLEAATSAYDSGTKYYNYSYDNAGYEMRDTVDAINNKVSSSMITTEPDLHGLANSLSTIIPDSAQKLAGIDKNATASKTAVEKAGTALSKAQAAAPKGGAKPVIYGFDDHAQALYRKIYAAKDATEEVVNRTPSDILPKAKDCIKAFDQPAPPDVLTLNPDGDIPLSPGDTEKVAISGGKPPFAIRLLCDCYNVGVTAQITYEGATATIVIAAADNARVDNYPLMVTDATGIGRSLKIVVSKKATDSADTPDCVEPSPLPAARTPPPKRGVASRATLNTVAQAAAATHAAALQAAKAAAAAKTDADTAEAAAKAGDKAGAANASERATRDVLRAYTARAKAQAKAREARAGAARMNDPS